MGLKRGVGLARGNGGDTGEIMGWGHGGRELKY